MYRTVVRGVGLLAFVSSCYFTARILRGDDDHPYVWAYVASSVLFLYLYPLGIALITLQNVVAIGLVQWARAGLPTSFTRWLEVQAILGTITVPVLLHRAPAVLDRFVDPRWVRELVGAVMDRFG